MKPPRKLLAALFLSLAARARAGDLVISEIHYDPPDKTALEEFIELYNAGAAAVDLSGWYLTDAVEFTFPTGTVVQPGEYILVAEKPEAIAKKFGAMRLFGPFRGNFSTEGERVTLRNAQGAKMDEVDYKVGFPWPVGSAGRGSSMELINPALDNDLGGSWRASTSLRSLPDQRQCLLSAQDSNWHYLKGTSEASDPPDAWRAAGFAEDGAWQAGQAPIGFGDADIITPITDMQGSYTSLYLRHAFHWDAQTAFPPYLKLRLKVDDGCIAWVNGVEVARSHVAAGDLAYNGVARSNDARWEEFLIASPAAFLAAGENLLAIHALNASLTSTDFSIDAELCIPARAELPPQPTPGAPNSVYSDSAPPQIRQVRVENHAGDPAAVGIGSYPRSGEPIVVTAKITDPDGVGPVSLKYQIVPPGAFIPAFTPFEPAQLMARPTQDPPPHPEFENPANWTAAPMVDDGAGGDAAARDGIFTSVIPPQLNRALVRYRITAADLGGAEATVPYPDDRSLNFACFVYDGIPPFKTTKASVHPEGVGYTYPVEVMESLPVYFLITRNADVQRCVAYNSSWQIPKSNEAARDAFNWEGAFVYNGGVYDHIRYRLRQANDRYGAAGKRSWRLRFHRGNYVQLHDQQGRKYPTRWRTLNTGKMFDNKGVGNFGLTETLNDLLWNITGVPAPFAHTFHFRVIDGAEEAPGGANGQYQGDFWGMALAMEDYEPNFLDAHRMADGNLYKLKDGIFDGLQLKRNQGRFSVTTDEDFQNIRRNLRPDKTDEWLNTYVNYDKWYPYHTVVEAIRHYDFVPADSHSKNRAWFFEPAEGSPLGRLWTLPWDADASWGPNWNDGIDYSTQAIFGGRGKPAFKLPYRNFIREFRDLLWTEEVINAMIDDLAAIIAEFSKADRDRWRGAPAAEGYQDFGPMEAKVKDMKNFAFTGWSGPTGPTVPAGGRARYLDTLAGAEGEGTKTPAAPSAVYTGPAGFPIDQLTFEASAFKDPQGDDSFGALKWRIGEVTDPNAPAFDPAVQSKVYEWTAVWESEEITAFVSSARIPKARVQPGHAYRVRVRMMDNTGRWSRWSAPVQFIAGDPADSLPQRDDLRVSEIMYNPMDGGDAEFIELHNSGSEAIDLRDVSFGGGIEFSFAASPVDSIGPGEYVVLVKNLAVFSLRYDPSSMRIAGEYGGKLDNGGEEIVLMLGSALPLLQFTYDDAWYPATDGGGYSLVLADPAAPPAALSEKGSWRQSSAAFGSPGRPDGAEPPPGGWQLPGDLTQDGKLNVTDAIGLLRRLFLGAGTPLPCEGGIEAGGNLKLLDLDGSRSINLTDPIYLLQYLFLSGPPPVPGSRCVRIGGCPDSCR